MTKKEFLRQAFLAEKRAKSIETQIEVLRNHAAYLTPQISETPTKSQVVKSKVEEAAVRIVTLQNELSDVISDLIAKRKAIAQAIRSINNLELETVLELRYLEYLSWEEIASRMGYSLQSAYKAHGKALQLVKIS